MACRFLFSTKMESSNQKMLEALAWAGRVTCTSAIVVTTNLPVIAELLETLDTAEEILDREAQQKPIEATPMEVVTAPKLKAKRQYKSGPLVECRVCHKQKSAFLMCKTGECKVCRMRGIKVAKSQAVEMSQPANEAVYDALINHPPQPMHSALPPKSEHTQENRAEMLARPKENVKLAGLRGRKVG